MFSPLSSMFKRTPPGVLIAAPIAALVVALVFAGGGSSVAPVKQVVAMGPGVPCSDGNSFDGDCCSAAGFEEESRFGLLNDGMGGFTRIECDNGLNHCEDGQDNDGDGLIDSADPECGSVGPGTSFAVIGSSETARNFSVRTGAESQIRHAKGDGSTINTAPASQFWVSGICDSGQCACPPTSGAPTLALPDCQVNGRACTTDGDCEAGGYPGNFSNASVCAWDYDSSRDAVIEGKLVVRGNVALARGYLPPRNLLNIGDKLVCDGCNTLFLNNSTPEPWFKYRGDAPWVGTGVCFPSLAKACYSDFDCATPPAGVGDLCQGRKQFAFSGHPQVDFTGGLDVPACAAAMAGMEASIDPNNPAGLTPGALPGVPAFDPNNPGADLLAVPPLTSNAIKVLAEGTQSLYFDGPGLHVREVDSLITSRDATLNLYARADAVVVIRVLGTMRIGSSNTINLLPDPNDPNDAGLKVSNLLWLLDGASGSVKTGPNSVFKGTILAAERSSVLIGTQNVVRGSLFAQQVDIKPNTEVLHQPFTGSVGTDLSLEKTYIADPNNPSASLVPPGVVVAGEDIIYTIDVANNGPTVATGVVVSDVLPEDPNQPGVDAVSVNSVVSSQGSCSVISIVGGPDRVVCFLGTLNITGTATITIDVTTKPFARGVLINTAQVDSSVEENLPADNTGLAATAVIGISDLSITKTDTPDPAVAGSASGLTYTVQVNNLGPSDATDGNVTVFDAVPANMVVVSADHTDGGGGGTAPCQVSTNTVTCQLGDIAVSDPNDVITIIVTPACDAHLTNGLGTPLTNTANVSNPGAEADPVAGNNSASTDSEYVGQVDLSSTKTDSVTAGVGYVIAGTDMFYTVNVNNAGPSTASNVEFNDSLPAGTALRPSSGCASSGGTPFVNQTISCAFPSNIDCVTSSNLQVNVDVAADVANGTTITNNVTSLSSANETETNGGNDASSTNTLVRRRSELAMAKSFAPVGPETQCVPGASVEYTMVVTNNGPSNSTAATVTDTFDPNLTCTWVCTAAGSASCLTGQPNGTGTAGGGNISQQVDIVAGAGNSVTYVATCLINPSMRGTLANTASVASEAGTLTEVNTADNSSNVSCPLVPRADLSVVKQVLSSDPHVAGVASDITYRVTVTNLGPSNAINGGGVTASDLIPAGVSVVSVTPSQGAACTGTSTRTCVLGALNAGNSATIDIVLTANCGTRGVLTNTASAVTGGEGDPNTPNTTVLNAPTIVGQVNLGLVKTASVETPQFVTANQNFTYTIAMSNTGPSDAQGLSLTDTLDADVTVQGPLPAGCTHPGGAGGTITCTIPDLACGTGTAQRVFTVKATGTVVIGDTGEIDNTASISSTDALGTTSANDTAETDLRRVQGDSCQPTGVDGDCATNFCVHNGNDNVCCNTACDAPICQACLQSKTGQPNGTCAVVSNNTDPDNECSEAPVGVAGECQQDGLCGGPNDGGSGVDRSGACGLRASGTGCTTANQLGTGGCSLADSCDGLGVCQPNDRPEFTACSGNGVNECSNADTCNNNGTCNDRDVAAGTQCTDTSPTGNGQYDGANECKDAQCTGTGACSQTFADESNGISCTDGNFCTVGDTCSAGTCAAGPGTPCDGPGDPDSDCSETCVDNVSVVENLGNCDGNDVAGSSCLINGVNECSNADTCNGAGTCLPNDVAAGTQCTDTLPTSQNNCKDAQCTGAGVCNQNQGNEPNGTSCVDGNFCNGTDTCNASGSCANHSGNPCPGADGDNDCSEQCVQTGTFPDAGNCNGNDPAGSACNDLDTGTFNDVCNGSNSCAGTPHAGSTPTDTVFVSNVIGSASGSCGDATSPCNTIALGLSRAFALGREGVCIEIGTYNETVTLVSGKNVRGGFARLTNGDWTPDQGLTTVNGAASGAVFGSNVSGLTVHRLRINSANASGANVSSYGVRLLNSTVTLSTNTIDAGNATTTGSTGANGSNGAAGGPGGSGGNGHCDNNVAFNGGAAGTSSCSRPGGGGGDGGFDTGGGQQGGNGTVSGGGGGAGGGGGGSGDPGGSGVNGAPGSGGSNGTNGSGGSSGSVSGNLWVSNDGSGGNSNATNGHGGGGGGGGGGQSVSINTDGNGGGGGGGGGGGCVGTPSGGGGGAGGSFGVFLVGSGTVTFTGNTILAGNGANGGSSGTRGLGGGGGALGDRGCDGGCGNGCNTVEIGNGGFGGTGGKAGDAGWGGGGAGGPSIGVFCSGTTVTGSSTCSLGSAGSGGSSGGGNNGAAGTAANRSGCGVISGC